MGAVVLMTREEDHAVNIDCWPVLASFFSIHRRYIPRHYHGLSRIPRQIEFEARADLAVVREIIARLRRGRAPSFGKSAPRLRAAAGPLGKRLVSLLSWLP